MTDNEFATGGAHPALVTALSARGYATPTPVQAMVLAAPQRDLLVSSQTGSGKTVAFGLVIGRLLLGDENAVVQAKKPRALVIAPTRELAQQVQRELGWLLTPAKMRVAAFTGGTDLRRDARALHHGVEVVVGTPGRLCDLLDRKALDLSGIEALVLDEADEMLDMGFREALETLLGAAPSERRTLLFSATLPPPIRALAKRFQESPVDIDPRAGRPAAAPHEDIRHVAQLCADGERLAALVNLLIYEDERAVVFCRTRDNVADLYRQLGKRGFSVEAISGERAQEERTRALDALRSGRVRVLVATDVAARGLDLPELGLVIHADLPESADSLTHRSGRTGRAGRKGVSVLLVERRSQRKAERLLREARLKVEWSAPPSAAAVSVRIRERLRSEVTQLATAPVSDEARLLANEVLADGDAERIVAALLARRLADGPQAEPLTAVTATAMAPVRAVASSSEMTLFQVSIGASDGADPKWILPMICRRGGVTRREVGAIRIAHDRTFVEIATSAAAAFATSAAERDPRAPNVRIERATTAMPARMPPRHPARRTGPPPKKPHASGHRPPARKPAR